MEIDFLVGWSGRREISRKFWRGRTIKYECVKVFHGVVVRVY
jgi:hypothetical protein